MQVLNCVKRKSRRTFPKPVVLKNPNTVRDQGYQITALELAQHILKLHGNTNHQN